MTTRSKKPKAEEAAQEATPAPLEIVSSEPEPAIVTPHGTESLFDTLCEKYSTVHLPDVDTMTLEGNEIISFHLLKSAQDYTAIQAQAQLLSKLCEDTKKVEKELPDLLPYIPIDYITIQDCCTCAQNLLAPFEMNFVQAVRLARTCGNLIPDMAATIRLKSNPQFWPKPPTLPIETPPTSSMVNQAQEAEDTPQGAQEGVQEAA